MISKKKEEEKNPSVNRSITNSSVSRYTRGHCQSARRGSQTAKASTQGQHCTVAGRLVDGLSFGSNWLAGRNARVKKESWSSYHTLFFLFCQGCHEVPRGAKGGILASESRLPLKSTDLRHLVPGEYYRGDGVKVKVAEIKRENRIKTIG